MSEELTPSHEQRATDEALAEVKLTADEAKKHGWKQWEAVKDYLLPGHHLSRSSRPKYESGPTRGDNPSTSSGTRSTGS